MVYQVIQAINTVSNFYLIQSEGSFILVDSGAAFSRGLLKKSLTTAGCRPGDLKLVVITHADADHTGSCIYLREKYGAKIAMHGAEESAAQTGNMKANRKTKISGISGALMGVVGCVMARPFTPDLFLADGESLAEYGLDAKVLHTPGHTMGSISIFTSDGDLFCGDFLNNTKGPRINRLTDDIDEMKASLEKIRGLPIKMIYPGHGQPFTLEELLKNAG